MNFFTKQGQALLVVAAVVVVTVVLSGCGGDSGTNSGGNGGGGGGGGSSESVVIGGKTWMKKNLNVSVADSWCYENSSDNCAKYGRLYTWQAAKSACQSMGWRLPDTADWRHLVKVAGDFARAGSKLKSRTGWTAYSGVENLDTYGFSALPGGSRSTDGSFHFVDSSGLWWTATEGGSERAYYRGMYYYYDGVEENWSNKSGALSARCVRD
jgi:uncharacterized protein (TIGR02145 family)